MILATRLQVASLSAFLVILLWGMFWHSASHEQGRPPIGDGYSDYWGIGYSDYLHTLVT